MSGMGAEFFDAETLRRRDFSWNGDGVGACEGGPEFIDMVPYCLGYTIGVLRYV
jgi:hypothetical protein